MGNATTAYMIQPSQKAASHGVTVPALSPLSCRGSSHSCMAEREPRLREKTNLEVGSWLLDYGFSDPQSAYMVFL